MEPKAPARQHPPLRIGKDAYLIRSLYGEDEGPEAVYINSMVIAGREPVVVDTGTNGNRRQWMADVFSIVDPEDIRWVFLSHDDHDHVGNLVALLEAAPKATLVTSWFAGERLVGDLSVPLERQRWVNDGDTFDAGDRVLVAVRPPVYDAPTTRGLFDPTTGVYWAVDSFATTVPVPTDNVAELDARFWDERFSGLNRTISPWHAIVDERKFGAEVDRVASLGATTIASGHSPLITGRNVDEAFRKIRRIAGVEPAQLPTQADLDALLSEFGLAPAAA